MEWFAGDARDKAIITKLVFNIHSFNQGPKLTITTYFNAFWIKLPRCGQMHDEV